MKEHPFLFLSAIIITTVCLYGYWHTGRIVRTVIILYLSLAAILDIITFICSNNGRGWRDNKGRLYTAPFTGANSFAWGQFLTLLFYFLIFRKLIEPLFN